MSKTRKGVVDMVLVETDPELDIHFCQSLVKSEPNVEM